MSKTHKSIDISKVFKEGYELYKKNIVTLLILGLILAIVNYASTNMKFTDLRGGIHVLGTLLRAVLGVGISSFAILYLSKNTEKKQPDVGKLASAFINDYLLSVIVLGLLLAVIIIGGLLLLVIPGILFALWFSQSYYYVVLENKTAPNALSASKKVTEGRRMTIAVIAITQFVISGIVSVVLRNINPAVGSAILSVFPATFFWCVDYVLFKHLKATV